jgi:GMP synthase (glutamine-hydrolysing)
MANVIVLQHVFCETIGSIGRALKNHGLDYRVVRGYDGEKIPTSLEDAKALIVMGGPMGAKDDDKLPFLKSELQLIEHALTDGSPILGVCLGSQLLARALGANVYPGVSKEIGWHVLQTEPEAHEDKLWKDAPASFQGFHWHGDIFDLPRGAHRLISSEKTPVQSFRYGENAYGILFHMEVDLAMIELWANTFAGELLETNQSASDLISGAHRSLAFLSSVGDKVFDQWAKLAAGS